MNIFKNVWWIGKKQNQTIIRAKNADDPYQLKPSQKVSEHEQYSNSRATCEWYLNVSVQTKS